LALIGGIKDAQVFLVRGNSAILRSLVVGRQSTDLYEVVSGLVDGDTVVVSGQNNDVVFKWRFVYLEFAGRSEFEAPGQSGRGECALRLLPGLYFP
jgi:hypothetical protein